MQRWLVIVSIFGFFMYHGLAYVIITELSGTDDAVYGASHSLQCRYEYENETGIEIKWFYNINDQMFVWIPNRSKPHLLKSWEAVLDSNETIPDHDMKHSVIHFKELNFNLSGNYTCKVTGDDHEAMKTEEMIVYQPASFVDFDLVSEENNTVTLICSVFELYPEPTITVSGLYLSEKNGTVVLYPKNETIDGDQNTLFNITKTFAFNKDELIAPTVEFSCNVAIGETNYSVTKNLAYTKSGYETTTTDFPEFYYYNDTTISAEYEISSKKTSVDNKQKPGDSALFNSTPSKLLLVFLLGLIRIR